MVIMKNWKTSAGGAAALLSSVGAALHSYSAGTAIDWNLVMMGVYTFWVGISAKDANVTGGTVPQTPEAIVRVESPEVITQVELGHTMFEGAGVNPFPPQRPTL
jgi:hypothetical protein